MPENSRRLPGKALLLLFLLICLAGLGLVIAGLPGLPGSGDNKLVAGKPFGPSAALPDPGKGYNGWYLSEAGVTETLFSLNFAMHLQPLLAAASRQVDPLSWEVSLKQGIQFHDHSPLNAEAVKWSLKVLRKRSRNPPHPTPASISAAHSNGDNRT